jgi:hypothetical protein
VAQQIIGRACSLDYIEASCKRKDFTKALRVWAWIENPILKPRVCWVTLPEPNGIPRMLEHGHRGLQPCSIIHLDIVEDMTGLADAPLPF